MPWSLATISGTCGTLQFSSCGTSPRTDFARLRSLCAAGRQSRLARTARGSPREATSILRTWDFDAFDMIREFDPPPGADGPVFLSYSPDGTRIVSGTIDGVVRLWDARTGHLLLEVKGPHGMVRGLRRSARSAPGCQRRSRRSQPKVSSRQDRPPRDLGHRPEVSPSASSRRREQRFSR